jgi:hypothetical protein
MQELTRNKRGIQSDKTLLITVNSQPGLSQYELTKQLDWPSGKVDGAIRRLINNNQIQIKNTQRNGRLANLIYPKDPNPTNIIEVPKNLLQFENEQWSDRAFVYALDSTTIGIAGSQMPEWKENACFKETIHIKKQAETIVLQIPEKFGSFYNIQRKHKTISVNGNTLLITISGNLIQEKKYPA